VKLSCPFSPLNFISGLRIFRRGQVRETSLNCTRVVPALAKVIASIRLWSRRPASGKWWVGKAPHSGFELEAAELDIAAHRGLST
jgi:hypothetical protein